MVSQVIQPPLKWVHGSSPLNNEVTLSNLIIIIIMKKISGRHNIDKIHSLISRNTELRAA